jgi:phosphoribosylformylglycinamidine synthase
MTPYEVMLSESQERMLIIPRAGKEGRIAEIFDKWGLDATLIGEVTGDGLFKVYDGEVLVGEVPVAALTEGCPVYVRDGLEPSYYEECRNSNLEELLEYDTGEAIKLLLASPNIASKHWVYSQYDHQVMINTVLVPGEADAAVLRIKGSQKGVALTTDCNARMVYLDPYQGGMMAVCEAARNLACVGARPLALTNCLNFGSPENPHIYWQMQEAIRGMAEAAKKLGTPVVSGNVSLYNETAAGAIFPTPVVGMVGLIKNIEHRCGMALQDEGDLLVLLGPIREELGGSEYLQVCYGLETGRVPQVDLQAESRLIELLISLIEARLLKSCHDISEGGLAIALAESAIKGMKGFRIKWEWRGKRKDKILFSEAPGRVVVSLDEEDLASLSSLATQYEVEFHILGRVGSERMILEEDGIECVNLAVQDMTRIWGEAIECHMK